MIRPLRQSHRILMGVLAVSLPVAVFLALIGRESPPPVRGTLPGLTQPSLAGFNRLLRRETGIRLGEALVEIRLYTAADPDRLAVVITTLPNQAFRVPDLLVYWTDSASSPTRPAPEESNLLGSLAENRPAAFVLPEAAASRGGRLLFYSLAHEELLDFEWTLTETRPGGSRQS